MSGPCDVLSQLPQEVRDALNDEVGTKDTDVSGIPHHHSTHATGGVDAVTVVSTTATNSSGNAVVAITDPGHAHASSAVTDPGHTHASSAVTDPGHAHASSSATDPGHAHASSAVTDPGHTHASSAVTDPGHTHAIGSIAFTPSAVSLRGEAVIIRPDGAATDLGGGGVHKADAPNPRTAGLTHPDHPRAVRLFTEAGTWVATDDVVVTITGRVRGVDNVTDVITIPSGTGQGVAVEGVVPFEKITSISWTTPANWTAGHFTVETIAGKFGLPLPSVFASLAISKVTSWDDTAGPPNPADDGDPAATDTTNGTITPTTAPTAAYSYRIVFSYSITPTGSNAGTSASGTTGATVGATASGTTGVTVGATASGTTGVTVGATASGVTGVTVGATASGVTGATVGATASGTTGVTAADSGHNHNQAAHAHNLT